MPSDPGPPGGPQLGGNAVTGGVADGLQGARAEQGGPGVLWELGALDGAVGSGDSEKWLNSGCCWTFGLGEGLS